MKMETSKNDLIEKIESFRNLLISYATGGPVTEREFKYAREELLAESGLAQRLPRFVRTVRDLKQFWSHIKQISATYQGRRDYLYSEFAPLLMEFEGKTQSPSDTRVVETLDILNSDTVHQAWRDALERRVDDADGAITSARTLLETVCRHILDKVGVDYENESDLPKLYRLTAKALSLAPSQQTEGILRQVAGGCTAVVEGIGALRNALGDAHGKGQSAAKPELRHAELTVNLAGALAVFLVQTWEGA
jgi:hypothetical protein